MKDTFEQVVDDDPTVYNMLRDGRTLEDVIVALVNEKHELAERCLKYALIAPKKLKMPDGNFYIWRCPDELVPEMP